MNALPLIWSPYIPLKIEGYAKGDRGIYVPTWVAPDLQADLREEIKKAFPTLPQKPKQTPEEVERIRRNYRERKERENREREEWLSSTEAEFVSSLEKCVACTKFGCDLECEEVKTERKYTREPKVEREVREYGDRLEEGFYLFFQSEYYSGTEE